MLNENINIIYGYFIIQNDQNMRNIIYFGCAWPLRVLNLKIFTRFTSGIKKFRFAGACIFIAIVTFGFTNIAPTAGIIQASII